MGGLSNIELAHLIVQRLIDSGVREFCICAGARNSPLVYLLEKNKQIQCYHFFEERSAGFFALGRYQSTLRPLAVVTTSGTAAAELLPAAIEGFYSSWPLVMLTADRPKSYRGTGAPQAIEQVGLYSHYAEMAVDLDGDHHNLSLSALKSLSWQKPVHINVCFKEPLIDHEIPDLVVPSESSEKSASPFCEMDLLRTQKLNKELNQFLKNGRPLVIVGSLPSHLRERVCDFLLKLEAPVYAEGISGLRGFEKIQHLLIQSGENFLGYLINQKICQSVLRLGGVPTVRLWRDLEEKYFDMPVLSLAIGDFSGLSRPSVHQSSLKLIHRSELLEKSYAGVDFLQKDQELVRHKVDLFHRYPQAEPSLIYFLSLKLKNQNVYLGNSLPIRHWDMVADFAEAPAFVCGNRGANGIDGQLSSFLGAAQADVENWGIFGDLTALYDLSSLWITSQLKMENFQIVIINNGGGMIFNRMFSKEIFLNRHQVHFQGWAQMWGWDYQTWTTVPQNISGGSRQIIEIIPDPSQTESFFQEWNKLWKF